MAERVAEMKRGEEEKDLVVKKDLDASAAAGFPKFENASEFDESEWPEEKNGHG